MKSNIVAIGLRAKTGRAIAVVLGGSADSPSVITKLEISLVDPKLPSTFQPYHVVMDLPWDESQRAVRKYVRAIEKVAAKNLTVLVKRLKGQGLTVKGVESWAQRIAISLASATITFARMRRKVSCFVRC